MDWPDRIPVEQPGQAERIEDRRLVNARPPARQRLDLELQPGPARHAHLRDQTQQPARLELLHAPPVESIPHPQRDRVAAPAADPYASDQKIEEAAEVPQPVHEVPPALATDSLDGRESLVRGQIDFGPA